VLGVNFPGPAPRRTVPNLAQRAGLRGIGQTILL
jgi:hypothetical protein